MTAKYIRSIRGKTLLFFILPISALVALALFVWYQQSLNYATALAKQNLSQTSKTVAATISEGNELAIRTVRVMALAQQNGLFGNRIESTQYARDILTMSSSLIGAYFGYEPNADGQDELFAESKASREFNDHDKSGRFIPYWYRDFNDNLRLVVEPLVDMETSLYYAGVKDLFLQAGKPMPMITEPYLYEGRMIVEHVFPIVIDGEFKGIAGVDRALADIEASLLDIKQRFHVDIFLISKMGRFIASTIEDADLEARLVKDTPYQNIIDALKNSQSETVLWKDPYDNNDYYFSMASIKLGEWTVLAKRSQEEVVSPIKDRFQPLAFYSFFGLFIIFIASLIFAHSISGRISLAVTSLKRLAEGDLEVGLSDKDASNDEVGIMFKSFDKLVQTNREIDNVCSHIAAGRFDIRVNKRGPKDRLADSINIMSKKRQRAEEVLKEQTETLRRTQKELIEAEKMSSLATLVSGVAHEVNTPLGIGVTIASHIQERIKLVDESMAKGELTKAGFEGAIREIEESCELLLKNMNRAADLIASFKRISVDQNIKEIQSIKLKNYLDSLLTSLHHQITQANIDIRIITPPNENEILTDPGALAQIFTNLIMNSIIHGFGNGQYNGIIRIAICYSKNNVNVIYQDTGKGVDEKTLNQIFDPFYTTNRQNGGSGLGLNIVYNLVTQRLKGSITAYSKPEHGILFRIKWPKNISDKAITEEYPIPATTPAN